MLLRFRCSQSFAALPQQPGDQVLCELIVLAPDVLWELNFSSDDILDRSGQVIGFEGSPAMGEQLVERNPTGPEVYFLIVSPTQEHLGCPIVEGSGDGEHFLLGPPFNNLLADPEVNELDLLISPVIENVLWFDVPMTDILRVNIGQSVDQLENYILDLLLAQIVKFHQARVAVVVHHQVASFLPVVHVHDMVADDVRVGQGLYIFKIGLQEHDVLLVHVDLLHGKQLPGGLQPALPDQPVAALPDLVTQLVALLELAQGPDLLLLLKELVNLGSDAI